MARFLHGPALYRSSRNDGLSAPVERSAPRGGSSREGPLSRMWPVLSQSWPGDGANVRPDRQAARPRCCIVPPAPPPRACERSAAARTASPSRLYPRDTGSLGAVEDMRRPRDDRRVGRRRLRDRPEETSDGRTPGDEPRKSRTLGAAAVVLPQEDLARSPRGHSEPHGRSVPLARFNLVASLARLAVRLGAQLAGPGFGRGQLVLGPGALVLGCELLRAPVPFTGEVAPDVYLFRGHI